MLMELIDTCDRADADDNVSAIIVTGAGRGFCAGADLSRADQPLTAAHEKTVKTALTETAAAV